MKIPEVYGTAIVPSEDIYYQKPTVIGSSDAVFVSDTDDGWIKISCAIALKSVMQGNGLFGAVTLQIEAKTNKIVRIWQDHNKVIKNCDPTAHAEITVIRVACKEIGLPEIGEFLLEDCVYYTVLYSSCEPCPMCMSAIYWSGIRHVYFSATKVEAAEEGVNFSDKFIAEELELPYVERQGVKVVQLDCPQKLEAFVYFKSNNTIRRYGQKRA